jgi:hypothetical protein
MAGGGETAPRLRPLAIGEILDGAIKVCTAHAGTLMKAVLVVVLPVQILSAIVLASTLDDPAFLDPTTTETGTSDTAAFWAGQLVIMLLTGLSFLLATGACFRAIAEGWLGRRPHWRESLGFAARRIPSLLWISILYVLGALVMTIFLILPGIWISIMWIVAYPVLFVEDRRGSKALGRSFRLVEGRWWASAGLVFLGFLLASVVGFILQFAIGLLAFANDSLGFLILTSTLATLVTQLLTTPFQAAIVALLYFDLRVRKEGFDLELLAARLSGGDPVAAGATAAPGAWIDEADAELRAQAPYWPPPPGWRPPEPSRPAPASAGEGGALPSGAGEVAAPPAAAGEGAAPPGWLPPSADER